MGTLDIQADYIKKAFEVVNSTGTGATVVAFCPAIGGLIPAAGLVITNLADQQNPITMGNVQVADTAVGPNGHGIMWTTANFQDFSVSVTANSVDDFQLTAALMACKKNGSAVGTPPPLWTIVVVYPNAIGQSRVLGNSVMINGEPGSVMGSNGRINCKTFSFRSFGIKLSEGTGGFSI